MGPRAGLTVLPNTACLAAVGFWNPDSGREISDKNEVEDSSL